MSIGRSPRECRAANARQSCHKSGGRGSPKPFRGTNDSWCERKRRCRRLGRPPGRTLRPGRVPSRCPPGKARRPAGAVLPARRAEGARPPRGGGRGGWVSPRRSAADRRRVVVRLTPKGRRIYQLATRRLILRWRRALRTFSGAEQLQLLSLLLRLLEGLQETAGQPARVGLRRLASP